MGRVVPALGIILGLAGTIAAGTGSPSWWAAPVLLACSVPAMLMTTTPAIARTRWASSPIDAVLAMTLALAPGAWLVAVVVVGAGIAQLIRRTQVSRAWVTLTRVFAAGGLAVLVTGQVVRVESSTVAAAGGMLVWWAVAHVLSVLAVARVTGRRVRPLLRSRALNSLPGVALGGAVGLTFGWLALHAPAGLLGLAAPVMVVGGAVQRDARSLAESKALGELARTAGGGRSLDDAAQLVVTAAARLLGGADIELVVVGSGELVCYAGSESGGATRTRLPATELDPWVARALSGRPGVSPEGTGAARRGHEDGRGVIAVPLGVSTAPVAALIARRPGTGSSFSRDEAMLADALATRSAAWLPLGGSAAPEVGQREAPLPPATAALRASAGRLARLAVADTDLDALLEELRSFETSVAGILAGDQPGDAPGSPPSDTGARAPVAPDPSLAWTTSGLLPEPRSEAPPR